MRSNSALTFGGDLLELVEKFVYLGSCVNVGGGVKDEMNICVVKTERLRPIYTIFGMMP